MWFTEGKLKVKLGGNIYINVPNLVVYKGQTLFGIIRREMDGLIGIDCDIFDKQGNKVAAIRRGNIVQGDKNNYKIIIKNKYYTIIEKSSRRFVCDIKKIQMVKDVELEVSVHLYTADGFLFEATPNITNLPHGNIIKCGTIKNCDNGIVINEFI